VLPALLLRFFEVEKRQDRNSQLPGLPLVELQAGRGPLRFGEWSAPQSSGMHLRDCRSGPGGCPFTGPAARV